jgi:hypothetical protein
MLKGNTDDCMTYDNENKRYDKEDNYGNKYNK